MNLTAQLSDRETQVAEQLAWGAARKEVADALKMSVSTVRKHAEHIFAKLQIQKITELSVWWFCEKCGVSWSLDPMKRFLAVALVLCCVSHDVVSGDTGMRARRARRGGRRQDTEYVMYL